MGKLFRKSLAIWATAFMVFSTLAVLATAAAEEGPAEARISQPGPQWKVNDYFRYEINGRSSNWNFPVGFTNGMGTCDFTGTIVSYTHYTVTGTSGGDYFLVSYFSEYWENGTWVLKPPTGTPSGPGNYYFYSKDYSTSPMKFRKTDLAEGESTISSIVKREYTWCDWDFKWANSTQTSDSSNTAIGGYFSLYRFPLDYGQTWQISGVQMSHITATRIVEKDVQGNTDTIVFNVDDTSTYTSGTGRTDTLANTPPQETQAGTFDDCFKIDISAFYDFTETGTASVNGVPQQVNVNDPGIYWATTRWYSNKAGYICNFNSTQLNNGLRLTDKHYISIPPNYRPEMETLGGQQYVQGISMTVREGEPVPVEFTVIDRDPDDGLNWSVVSVVGSSSNLPGATLMDGAPPFSETNPTSGNINQVHSNKLMITAKQPKTVDRDEYTININVNDGRDGGSLNFSFKVKVQNVNNKPYVAMPIPEITMRENSTMTCTTWKLTDIFKDQDREAGIVDPLTFTAVVTAGPSLTTNIDQDTGIVTFIVPDYAIDQTPLSSWDSTIKFTCSDSGSGNVANKASNNTNAKLHVDHVNHDPLLSDNGNDLAENGLTWAGDQIEPRLNLNNAFFDPDIKYADDSLTFSWSGQKMISVKNNAGRITLTPTIYWNGKETIKFKAVDKLGRSKELRLECTVTAVNHAPQFCETDMDITWDNEDALTIREANSATSAPNKMVLAISVFDPDTLYGTDTHDVMWYVNDTNGNLIYKTPKFSQGDDDYEFRCAFTGMAANAYSSVGSPYEVKAVVKDKGGLYATYIWNVTVLDTNRPPSARYDSPIDNKTFTKGKKIYFDGWNSTDLDEAKENLTFIWNSSKQGMIKQDRGQAGAQFSLGTLKTGTHIITLTVMDSSGGESVTAFTVKVKEPDTTPGFEGLYVVAVVAAVAMFVAWRRRS